MVMETDRAPQKQKRGCICKSKKCRELTKCFNSIKDIRGRFFTIPTVTAERNGDIKRFKVERMIHHLDLSGDDAAGAVSYDIRDT